MSISGYSCALRIALVYVCALIKRPFPPFLSLMKFLRYSGGWRRPDCFIAQTTGAGGHVGHVADALLDLQYAVGA
mgnify:CR=1 FL=1